MTNYSVVSHQYNTQRQCDKKGRAQYASAMLNSIQHCQQKQDIQRRVSRADKNLIQNCHRCDSQFQGCEVKIQNANTQIIFAS